MTRSFIPILALLLLACGLRAQSAGSASFALDAASFASSAGRSGSASFNAEGVLGTATPAGASSSASYLVQGGPLAWLGAGPVPVLLLARMAAVPESAVQLDWSGNAPGYSLYRATDCSAVSGQLLTTQSQKTYLDPSASGETLVCYLVVQTAD